METPCSFRTDSLLPWVRNFGLESAVQHDGFYKGHARWDVGKLRERLLQVQIMHPGQPCNLQPCEQLEQVELGFVGIIRAFSIASRVDGVKKESCWWKKGSSHRFLSPNIDLVVSP